MTEIALLPPHAPYAVRQIVDAHDGTVIATTPPLPEPVAVTEVSEPRLPPAPPFRVR
jgi:hypothetical protein